MAKKKDLDLMTSSAKVKLGVSDIIIRTVGYIIVSIYAICCIFPFLIIVSSSFTNEKVIRAEGVQLIPKEVTLEAYNMVCKGGTIWWSYVLTIVLTVVGTAIGLSCVVYASTLGVGVALSAIPIFLYQGAIALGASFLAPYLTEAVILEMKCVGSILILGLSLNMLGLTKIKVMNYVPAVFLPILLCRFL